MTTRRASLLVVLFWMGLALTLAGSAAAAAPTVGLVGYWPFDGSYDDASGAGNHGQNKGASLTADRFGRPNRALDTTAGWVSIPDDPTLAFDSGFTFAAWIRQDAIGYAFNCLAGKNYTSAFAIGIGSGGNGICPDPSRTRSMLLYVGDQPKYFSGGPSFDCGTGQWWHVAVSYDAATHEARLYVDGVLAESFTHTGTLGSSTSALGIGRDGHWNARFTGRMDEVRLYNRALSANEVAALLDDGATEPSVETPGVFASAIAAAASASGLNDTRWRTDLVLHNSGQDAATVDLFFLATGTDNSSAAPVRMSVPAEASLRLPDAVRATFGRDDVTGAVLVGADRDLMVSSRTFNDTASGTFGQSIPGVEVGHAQTGTTPCRVVQLAHSSTRTSGFRTNIGAVNLTGTATQVTVELFAGDGTRLGQIRLDLPPWGHVQASDVFASVSAGTLDDAFAVLHADNSGARYLAYASVVDNRSGDPVYLPAQ